MLQHSARHADLKRVALCHNSVSIQNIIDLPVSGPIGFGNIKKSQQKVNNGFFIKPFHDSLARKNGIVWPLWNDEGDNEHNSP